MTARNGLSFCMIARNEENRIGKCLDSVCSLTDEQIVVDTGSTDGTPQIAAARGARVIPFDFTRVDFAAARNRAVEAASGRWILVLDADETLDAASIPAIRDLVAGDRNAGYFFERRNHAAESAAPFSDHVVRLFPNRPEIRYRGRVHETIDCAILAAGGKLVGAPVRIDHTFSVDPEARRRKNFWYIGILKEEIAADPADDTRLDFLAAEYHQLEMFAEATRVAEQIAQRRPQDARAHLFAGLYHMLYQPDFARARADFNQALQLRPGYPEAVSFLQTLDEWERG